jgi:hypothetical protein
MELWAIAPNGEAVWAALLPFPELGAFLVKFVEAMDAADQVWPFNVRMLLYRNQALILMDSLECEEALSCAELGPPPGGPGGDGPRERDDG